MSSYKLKVENNEIINEEGSFFRAAPFTITSEGAEVVCCFKRNEEKHVTYQLIENGTLLAQYVHQDYSPECPPEDLKENLKVSNNKPYPFIAAMVHLGLSHDPIYKALYQGEGAAKYSFEVSQEPLIN
ncbi:hypothetical protein DID80_04695 [Candidatus Marinamargulisbacteria bacterium SCGC AAA071-K20]|nr:hypothetical protein DID80_04695 [Candidatus Marinamargulisbacteria bacterium SCGC AAA071-K20]